MYTCVTNENCKNWDKFGRSDFIKQCKFALQNAKDESPAITTKSQSRDLKRLLYEICWQVLKGNLRLEQATGALADVIGLHADVTSTLADIETIIDVETQCAEDKNLREKFITLVNACFAIIPEKVVKERLDVDTLADVGVIKNKSTFYTKFIRIKTKLFYKQQKFNLLREESEGYAKLITELNQELNRSTSPDYLLEVIKSLIGCFNLDPNRVLDIILESFENRPEHYDFFIPLMRSYMCDQTTLCEVLGFKFEQALLNRELSQSLYTVTALMLQHKLIPLDAIYSHLKPKDSEIVDQNKKDLVDAQQTTKKLAVVTLAGDKPTEKMENVEDRYQTNQKLGLCLALLQIGDWEHTQMIISRLPPYYAMSYKPIQNALCSLLHFVLEPVYRSTCQLLKSIKKKAVATFDSPLAARPATNFVDMKANAFPMLSAIGLMLHTDPLLLVKVIRLTKGYFRSKAGGKHTLLNMNDEPGLEVNFIQVVDEVLLPSLSLLECNCCIAEELWSLLFLLPYQQRYYLYARWKNESYQSHPLLIKTRAETMKKIAYIMKRLSKENVKPSGRHIGKLSHSNPGLLFDYILSQIQMWNNLIGPVVDSLKYLTNLSYDVLAYCIIEALANPEKQRMKHDGTSISLWLQSLSNFCGAIFKKYPIELTGLLQYVANQLKAEKSLDLLILKEIVQKMAGIEALEEMTADQLEAMAGGELLRAEGGYFSLIRNTKKSSLRLKDALLEQDLAIPLCILMAQQRNCVIYKEQENSHVKLVGKLYDQCQDTLVQFGSFLATNLSMDDYVNRLPPVNELMSGYHIMSDVAFFLSRPLFAHAIASKFDELRKLEKSNKTSSQSRPQKYLDVVESVMSPIVESVKPLHQAKVWDDISPQFFMTFWSLTMYDLYVPSTSYEREIGKLKTQIVHIEDNKDMVQSKKKKEIERCKALMEKIQDEQKKQRDHCERVLTRLKNEKDSWFLSRSAKNETITQFLQLCVFPRCIFTAIDAIYCARFVHTIHNLKTPNFSTLICYDRIFCDITYTVTSCTENEANRYGRFLCAMLETVMRWHSNKEIFEKECTNYPGFVTKFRVANQATENASDHVDYENYRHVCHKWHFKITKAMVTCLTSGDYVQIRNSLIILTKILPHYPVVSNLAIVIENRIKNVQDNEKQQRPDLFTLALAYLGQLKTKKSVLIHEHEFHLKEVKESDKSNNLKNDASNRSQTSSSSATKEVTNNATNENKSEKAKEHNAKESTTSKDSRRVTTNVKSDARPKSDSRANNSKLPPPSSGKSLSTSTGSNSGSTTTKKDSTGTKSSGDKESQVSSEKNVDKNKKFDEKVSSLSTRESREERFATKDDKGNKVEERSRGEKSQSSRDEGKDKNYDSEERRHAKEAEVPLDSRTDRSSSVSSNNSSSASHSLRRSVEPSEIDRDPKRRKLEHPLRPGKNLRRDEKIKESEKVKEKTSREKSRSREPERELLNHKEKEKKLERKRERFNDDLASLSDNKRRKEENSGKISRQQNGDPDRDKDYHHREATSDKDRMRDRKSELKDEKKHETRVDDSLLRRRGTSKTTTHNTKKSRKTM